MSDKFGMLYNFEGLIMQRIVVKFDYFGHFVTFFEWKFLRPHCRSLGVAKDHTILDWEDLEPIKPFFYHIYVFYGRVIVWIKIEFRFKFLIDMDSWFAIDRIGGIWRLYLLCWSWIHVSLEGLNIIFVFENKI